MKNKPERNKNPLISRKKYGNIYKVYTFNKT